MSSLWDVEESDPAGLSGRFSRVDHVSFDIEEQERILRQHILGSNLIQKDRSNVFGGTTPGNEEGAGEQQWNDLSNALQIGNIYKFNQNRNYYDSLESLEILRNEQPEYIEGGLSQGSRRSDRDDHMNDSSSGSELRRGN